MKNQRLHAKTKMSAVDYLKSERLLFGLLVEVQKREAYREYGHKGLFNYCVKELGLTDSVAQMFRTVVNHAVRLPQLNQALRCESQTNGISVSYASRIVSSLTPENVDEVLGYAAEHSIKETESWLVREKGIVRELKISIDSETLELLKVIKEFLGGNPKNNDILKRALKEFRDRHHPLEKAKRSRKMKKSSDTTEQSGRCTEAEAGERSPGARKPLTARQKHTVNLRDENRCTFSDSENGRCTNRRWLAKHHIVEVSEGGSNDPSNILTLCPEHHDLVHQMSFTWDMQRDWIPTGSPAH